MLNMHISRRHLSSAIASYEIREGIKTKNIRKSKPNPEPMR